MDCKEILEMMGLPDYNAWEIVKRTNACLMEDPFWLRFSEDETFDDTTRGREEESWPNIRSLLIPISIIYNNVRAKPAVFSL